MAVVCARNRGTNRCLIALWRGRYPQSASESFGTATQWCALATGGLMVRQLIVRRTDALTRSIATQTSINTLTHALPHQWPVLPLGAQERHRSRLVPARSCPFRSNRGSFVSAPQYLFRDVCRPGSPSDSQSRDFTVPHPQLATRSELQTCMKALGKRKSVMHVVRHARRPPACLQG